MVLVHVVVRPRGGGGARVHGNRHIIGTRRAVVIGHSQPKDKFGLSYGVIGRGEFGLRLVRIVQFHARAGNLCPSIRPNCSIGILAGARQNNGRAFVGDPIIAGSGRWGDIGGCDVPAAGAAAAPATGHRDRDGERKTAFPGNFRGNGPTQS